MKVLGTTAMNDLSSSSNLQTSSFFEIISSPSGIDNLAFHTAIPIDGV